MDEKREHSHSSKTTKNPIVWRRNEKTEEKLYQIVNRLETTWEIASRPKLTWIEHVKDNLGIMHIEEMRKKIMDMKGWRKYQDKRQHKITLKSRSKSEELIHQHEPLQLEQP